VAIDFVQEHRAERAVLALRATVAHRATVLRDGRTFDVPSRALVPGDVIQLEAGDLVPADARVLQARDLQVVQAALTGEPYPVEKRPRPEPSGEEPLADAPCAVLSGSTVVVGGGRALVVRTGQATMIGQTALATEAPAPPTEFEQGTRDFGRLIVTFTFGLVLFVLLVNGLAGRPVLQSFLFALALAVGLTPELLPMVVSVTLARGAQRMARNKVVVKRLTAIHDLGSMDVLCTDKTGTLTEARIRLEAALDVEGNPAGRVLRLAALNARLQAGVRSPLDEGILAAAEADPSMRSLDAHVRKLDEVPFHFERRRLSVLVDDGGEAPTLIVKGAAEEVLAACARVRDGGDGVPIALDHERREAVHARVAALAEQGLRSVLVATRAMPIGTTDVTADDERDLVLDGVLAFVDPPKPGADRAIAGLRARGVQVKVVTGDHALVARHVARALGLLDEDAPDEVAVLGHEIDALDDDALRARVELATLFCQVSPVQKQRVILALRAAGHVVGYLGDGINDTPSLRAADVGVSVDGAVDVAREAADLILLEHDLNVLLDGVVEGRRTFANVQKYVLMGTSSNFGNMFSMALATLVIPFLPMLPSQILLNNLLYDVSEIAIPLDDVDPEALARPRRWDNAFVRRYMLLIGPISSLFDALTFWVLLRLFAASPETFRTGWFVESLASQVLVIFVIRTRRSVLLNRPHRLLAATSLAVVALAVLVPYTPMGAQLSFVPLPASALATIAALVAGYLAVAEGAKRLFYAYQGRIERRATPAPGAPRHA
jgi:Mg2+-importing ATPase